MYIKLSLATGLVPSVLFLSSAALATTPVDRWVVEVSPGKCRLERTFSAPTVARLSVDTDVGSDDYSLSVAKAGFNQAPIGMPESAVLKIDGRTHTKTFVAIFAGDNKFKQLANVAGLSGEVMEAMSAGREFSIQGETIRVGPLPTPDAAKGFAALRRCETQQLIEWGADAAQFEPGGSQPKVKNRYQLIPQSKLRQFRNLSAPASLLHYLVLDEAGVVQRCASVFGPNGGAFERAICAEMVGRKIGTPALNPGGKPVRGVVTFTPALLTTITRSE